MYLYILSPTTERFVYPVVKCVVRVQREHQEPRHSHPGAGACMAPVMYWQHSWTMPDSTLYGLLGLEPTASPRSIKSAYRTLAKRLHPDKSQDPDAIEVFQKLNNAYQILCDSNDSSLLSREDRRNDVEISLSALPNISIVTRENTFSVTIDITDIMFLAFLEECQQHHCVSPVDRGHNGIQLRFEYASPDDANEHFGTISLASYATTSRLLVQGTSYLLWIDEHLPIIYKKAEQTYEENIGKWRSLARRRGIGVKRVTHQAREGRGHIIPTDPKGDRTGLPTSPHSPNTHPPASDKVSPSSAACPHAVCVPHRQHPSVTSPTVTPSLGVIDIRSRPCHTPPPPPPLFWVPSTRMTPPLVAPLMMTSRGLTPPKVIFRKFPPRAPSHRMIPRGRQWLSAIVPWLAARGNFRNRVSWVATRLSRKLRVKDKKRKWKRM